MTAPNLEMLDDEPNNESQEGTDPIDSQESGSNIEPQTPTPTAPSIDWAAMYRESLADRRRMEAEIEEIRKAQSVPRQEDVDITDEYFEKHGTAKGVAAIVETKVAKLLQQTLGDVGEISQDFKRNKQLSVAEDNFYRSYPQLAGYREQLAPNIRQFLANAPNVDPRTYEQTTLAAIGAMTISNLGQTPAPTPTPSQAPSVPSAPTPRGGQQVRTPVRRLTEIERTAMRRAGFDPNKAESINEFFAIVENDEGVSV